MEKFFYFRDATNEDADLSAAISATIPVSSITGIGPHANNTSLNIWFTSLKNEAENEYATLTVTQGKLKETMAELVSIINGGPNSDGFVVIADNAVTTDGATSIQGNDIAVAAKYASTNITGVALVTD